MTGPGGLGRGRVVTDDAPLVGRDTFRRVVRQFRPYRARVILIAALIAVTSGIGVVNPILIQVVFDTALFVRGGPDIPRLALLVTIMAINLVGDQLRDVLNPRLKR